MFPNLDSGLKKGEKEQSSRQCGQLPQACYFPAMMDHNLEQWTKKTPSPLSYICQSVSSQQQEKKQRCLCSVYLGFLNARITDWLPCQQAQV